MNISTLLAPAMLSRKRRRMGDVLIIKLPTPNMNIILVNRRTPIQTLTRISAERILKEEKVEVILEHLRD
jgi:hypothetical protein